MYGDKERKEDFKYFLSIYDELYKKYGTKYFAIKNKQILGVYDNMKSAIENTKKEYPLGTFIVQKCNGDESGYTNYISSWQLIKIS